MRNEIKLTDEQIEEAFDALDGCATVSEEYGCDVVFTRETLEDFAQASKSYNECNVPRYETVNGLKALCLDRAQVRKGDQRKDVIIIDFGAVRGVSM